VSPIRLCIEALCPNPVRDAGSKGRCDFHYRQLERERSRVRREDVKARNRFYARKRWAMVRRRKLFEQPLCEYVENDESCGRIAEHVHHIIDLADGGDEYTPSNLMSLCKPHHSRITIARQRGRVADDGPSAA
jgi:5-methylcytosine-specific restriction endonuclease McrA